MTVTLDIQGKASPFIRDTRLAEWTWKVFGFNLLHYVNNRVKKQLDEFILSVEGFHKHVVDLTLTQSEELLYSLKKVIRTLDKIDEVYASLNYGGNKEIKEKYKYLLKALYRLESLLHIQATKDIPVGKAPEYILQGLTNISNASKLINQQ